MKIPGGFLIEFAKSSLKVSTWEFDQGSPDPFPITYFSLILKGIPQGFHMEIYKEFYRFLLIFDEIPQVHMEIEQTKDCLKASI